MAFGFLRRKAPKDKEDSHERRLVDENSAKYSKWVKPKALHRGFLKLAVRLVSDALLVLSALAFLALAGVVRALDGLPTASNAFGYDVVAATQYVCSHPRRS